jgi:hypothetical protein
VIARPCYRRKDLELITGLYRSMGMEAAETELERFLPLSDAAYVVLLALEAQRVSHREFLSALEDSVRTRAPSQGELLAELDRLVAVGLVAVEEGSDESDERYRVTGLGEAVRAVESGRRSRRFDVPTMPTLRALAPTRPSMS